MLFLLLFERWFGWSVVICNLLALCISGVLNFFLSEAVVFRKVAPRPEHELLTIEELAELSPLFRGNMGTLFARFAMWACGISRLNRLYDSIYHLSGPEAAHEALKQMGCDYLVGNPERLSTLPEGPFITISNHPYGGLDGVIVLDMIGHHRPKLKIMVNKILGRIDPLKGNFITVTPTETEKRKADATTLSGLRAALSQLHKGEPLSLFPSGAVSDLHPLRGDVSDRKWQEGILKFIERAQVPIVPIHFEGRNSLFYYLLGVIDWRIRLLRLPREVLNKGRGTHRVVIGPTISVKECSEAARKGTLGDMLRKAVYELPSPNEYTPSSELNLKLNIVIHK
jgi:putative hemolysin